MAYIFEKYTSGGGSGGGSGIIDVTELPTENIDENAVYRVNGYAGANVYCVLDAYDTVWTFEELIHTSNPYSNVSYFVVDNLPENPQITDFSTFNAVYVYINSNNNIPYLYGDVGYGNMWLDLATVLEGIDVTLANKGYVENKYPITEAGIYVTYKKNPVAVAPNADLIYFRDEWVNTKGLLLAAPLFLKELKGEDFANILHIKPYAFANEVYYCTTEGTYTQGSVNTALEKVTIPSNILSIGTRAFARNDNLTTVVIEKGVLSFVNHAVFEYCSNLLEIHYGGTKEEWKAIRKSDTWDDFMEDYTIYCTDGTIAKDGTET